MRKIFVPKIDLYCWEILTRLQRRRRLNLITRKTRQARTNEQGGRDRMEQQKGINHVYLRKLQQ